MIKVGQRYKTKSGRTAIIHSKTLKSGEFIGEIIDSGAIVRYNSAGQHAFSQDYDLVLESYTFACLFSDFSISTVFGSKEYIKTALESHPLRDKLVGFMRIINNDLTTLKYVSKEEFDKHE